MKYTKGYKYQLYEDEYFQTDIIPIKHIDVAFIELNITGLLRVKRGYASDGPSGPTKDRKENMRPSFGHDAFCQLLRLEELDKKWLPKINEYMKIWCIEDGMWGWWAEHYYHHGLDKFDFYANPKNKKKIYEVP